MQLLSGAVTLIQTRGRQDPNPNRERHKNLHRMRYQENTYVMVDVLKAERN